MDAEEDIVVVEVAEKDKDDVADALTETDDSGDFVLVGMAEKVADDVAVDDEDELDEAVEELVANAEAVDDEETENVADNEVEADEVGKKVGRYLHSVAPTLCIVHMLFGQERQFDEALAAMKVFAGQGMQLLAPIVGPLLLTPTTGWYDPGEQGKH
jgi:hypothetical protein